MKLEAFKIKGWDDLMGLFYVQTQSTMGHFHFPTPHDY